MIVFWVLSGSANLPSRCCRGVPPGKKGNPVSLLQMQRAFPVRLEEVLKDFDLLALDQELEVSVTRATNDVVTRGCPRGDVIGIHLNNFDAGHVQFSISSLGTSTLSPNLLVTLQRMAGR